MIAKATSKRISGSWPRSLDYPKLLFAKAGQRGMLPESEGCTILSRPVPPVRDGYPAGSNYRSLLLKGVPYLICPILVRDEVILVLFYISASKRIPFAKKCKEMLSQGSY